MTETAAQALSVSAQPLGGTVRNTVNARSLHAFLGVGKDFSNWVKDRIQQHGFVENQDFIVFAKIGENSQGGRPAREYHLTVEAAKHIAMTEHTPKGKEARDYFIECERRLLAGETTVAAKPARKKPVPLADRSSPLDAYLPVPYFRVIAIYLDVLKIQKRIGKDGLKAQTDAARITGQALGVDAQRYLLLDSLPEPVAETRPQTGNQPHAADQPEALYLTATQIAEQLNLRFSTNRPNGHAVNDLLCAMGLAHRLADHRILPTPEGVKVCHQRPVLDPLGKPTKYETLTWDARIVDRLRRLGRSGPMPLFDASRVQ